MLLRDRNNPLLMPSIDHDWDCTAAFNPCVVKDGCTYRMVYRAQGPIERLNGHPFSLSSIGHAESEDGIHFGKRRQIIRPEHAFERFGCEDPRITRLDDRYFIFYTCLSLHPFEANGIRIGVAITRDFEQFEKHAVTPFNAKAMALFPERIDGHIAAILTVHTDMPPAKVAIAYFDRVEDIWSQDYWLDWYQHLDQHVLPLLRSRNDHVEVGAPPLRTADGWLLIHSYIRGYFTSQRSFGVETVMLDLHDPMRVRGRRADPLLVPEHVYELKGSVADVVFPSGAVSEGDALTVYYGAADTTCCAAHGNLAELLHDLTPAAPDYFVPSALNRQGFERYAGNPILAPRPEFTWEARAAFNPGAIDLDGKVHLIYRAMSADGTSSFGYAASRDGIHFDERLPYPVYEPREPFELKLRPGNSGCEDPRLTVLDGDIYVFYAAFDGYTPRVAYSSIAIDDFLAQRWHWRKAMVISPPGIDDKDACLLPSRINGRYVIFHRFGDCIRVNSFDSLAFGEDQWLDRRSSAIKPRKEYWDNRKFGICGPPIATPHGWLLLFHRVTQPNTVYKVEAMLLDRDDPAKVIAETAATLLEPETTEERYGETANVVFPCGAVVRGDEILLYYGAADSVICLAKVTLPSIYKRLGL